MKKIIITAKTKTAQMQPAGLRLGQWVREQLMADYNMDITSAQQFADKMEKMIKQNDWISLSDGTTLENSNKQEPYAGLETDPNHPDTPSLGVDPMSVHR